MSQDESWVGEQLRLLTLEEGFGPDRAPRPKQSSPEVDPELAA